MFTSLIQSKYATAKDIVFAGFRYAQEHARLSFGAKRPIPDFVYSMVEEYKMKERCISFVSNPYSYFSMFWETGLTYVDTPIKKVFAMQVVLAIVFVMLNYLFIKIQGAFLKQQDKGKPIETLGNDEEKRATEACNGVQEGCKMTAHSISTKSDEKQANSKEREFLKRPKKRVRYELETGVEEMV